MRHFISFCLGSTRAFVLLPRAMRRVVPVLLSGVIGIVFLWAGVGHLLSVERQAAIGNAVNDTGNFARAFQEQITGIVRGIDQTLFYVRSSYIRAPAEFDMAPWSEHGEFLTHPAFQVLISGKDGYLRASSLVHITSPVSVGDRDYFRALAEATEDRLFISKPVVGRLSGKWSIQFARRMVGADGSFAGVVVVSFDPFYLSRFYESLHLSSEGVVVLMGADGIILARAPNGQQTIGLSVSKGPLMRPFDAKANGSLNAVSPIDGVKRIYSYRAVEGYPLQVAVGMSEHDALLGYYHDRRAYVMAASTMSGLFLVVIALFVLHQTRLGRAREALRGSEARCADKSRLLEVTLDNMTQGIMMIDAGLTLQVSNRRVAELLDMPETLFAARPPFADVIRIAWQRGDFDPCIEPFEIWFADFLHARSGHIQGEKYRQANGTMLEVFGKRLSDGGIVCTFTDITERTLAEDKVAQMARYDSLTGLVNRRVFVEVLEQAIARARRCGTSFAVLYLDLDHFKDVNDTLGHPVGDILLETVADRLRANVRDLDTIARFGGDEFAIILTDVTEPANASFVSERILDAIAERASLQQSVESIAAGVAESIVVAMSEPIAIQANRIHSGASIGITVYGPDLPDAETMLSRADVALYRAKAEQRGTFRFFTDGMDAEVRARVSMGTELREALASDQFFLVYQPQVDIETGLIVGLEALVRWQHPTLGTLGPGKFISAMERNGLSAPLGRWVMAEACRQTRQWLDAGIVPSLVAVNLSGVEFKRPLELEEDIAAVVAEYRVPPHLLELELTEGVLMKASRDHNDVLLRLRSAGHRIAIDDFGIGYSSLDYLRRFPVDRIKIAQTFIADIGIEPGNDAIVRAALGLARELNIEVVVEGVETDAQIRLLKTWGARIVQGYYFAKPLPVPEVTALLRAGKITPTHADLAEIAAN